MSQSIYETLKNLETETSVPGHGMVPHSLPRNLLPTDEQFENAEMLEAWARDNNILHSVLQKGVKGFVIDLRAIFKAVKKDETWSLEKGQKAVDNAKWSVTKRPVKGDKIDAKKVRNEAIFDVGLKMARSMLAMKGISDRMVSEALIASYGEDLATEIFNTVKKELNKK